MNVYDFDKTIYKKDSSVQLYLYVLGQKPYVLFLCIAKQVKAAVFYKLGKISKERYKEVYFSFLKYVNIEEIIDKFVSREMKNIAEWYQEQKRKDDVIISASPEFLVKAFANKLGIKEVIASDIDCKSGAFHGKNCHGQEKVERFRQRFDLSLIEKFYSDSRTDEPMALQAEKAFLIKRGKVVEWDKLDYSFFNCSGGYNNEKTRHYTK